MPLEDLMIEMKKDIKSIGRTVDKLHVTTSGLEKAVKIQNGRVSKLETRWENVIGTLIIALIATLLSLTTYIFLNSPIQISQSDLEQALEGMELSVDINE